MAKTKTATAAEPNEFYDSLDQTSQDTWDAIASYGWRPGHSEETNKFFAVKGDDTLGPFELLSELLEVIQRKESTDEMVSTDEGLQSDVPEIEVTELDEDHKGNTYLPGVKPVVDQQLATAAGDFFAANTEWTEAGKVRKDKKATLETIAQMKKSLFHPDPDNSNSLIYHAGGLLIRIAKESATKVTVEVDKEKDA